MKAKIIEKVVKTIAIPHDWTFKTWPLDIYPYDGAKGRHVVRAHQSSLLAAGALTRIGREIVVLGAGYTKWMVSNTRRVVEYEVAPNRPEHAAKRFGRRDGTVSGA